MPPRVSGRTTLNAPLTTRSIEIIILLVIFLGTVAIIYHVTR